MAAKRDEDEAVVASRIERPDRETCGAPKRSMDAPRMAGMGEMPFDGKRMMWGGFEPIVVEG